LEQGLTFKKKGWH